MSLKKCVNCHKTIFLAGQPDWCGCEQVTAWLPEKGESEDEAEEYFTRDTEELATEIAEDYWNNDPSDPTKFKLVVCIKGRQGGIETFNVSADVSVDFTATAK